MPKADADADVQRQALDLQHNAHRRQLDIPVGGGEPVDDDVGQVEQEQAQRRRNAHREQLAHRIRRDALDAPRDRQHALPLHAAQHREAGMGALSNSSRFVFSRIVAPPLRFHVRQYTAAAPSCQSPRQKQTGRPRACRFVFHKCLSRSIRS